jgi:peroxiredoxin
MSITALNKYPYFELSEIIPELSFDYKVYKPLSPVKAGNYIPDFALNTGYEQWQQFYNGAETHGPVIVRHLLNKPLVISFYSHHWKNAGLEQLKQLNAIQYEIKANGGNLLIINAERVDELQKIAWEQSLSLNFYYDKDNEIAKKFRIYSDENPTWNSISGIDTNVPLMATYVIEPSRQIIYNYIDNAITGELPVRNILAAVYESALMLGSRKSA